MAGGPPLALPPNPAAGCLLRETKRRSGRSARRSATGAGGKGVPGKRVPEGVRGVFAAQKPEDAGGRRASAPADVTPAPSFPGTPFPPAPTAERPKRSPPNTEPQYPPLDHDDPDDTHDTHDPP